jgi:transcriptional regulator with XRE-family HTH domain
MPRNAGKSARRAPKADPHALSTRLREIARNRNLSASAIAREADLDPGMVQRFLTGQRDIRLATADAIAAALGLRLVEVGRGRGRPRPAPMAGPPTRARSATAPAADARTHK